MWKTITRRFLVMIPQLFLLSLLIFILAQFMPGDPLTGKITPETDPRRLDELRDMYGLNDPWYEQYTRWIVSSAKGDLGASYTYKIPVTTIIGERALNTFWLSLVTTIMLYAIAIP